MKRLLPIDVELINLTRTRESAHAKTVSSELAVEAKDASIRLKVRGLIVPRRIAKDYYKYDLSDFGLNVLKAANEKENAEFDSVQKSSFSKLLNLFYHNIERKSQFHCLFFN